MNTHVKILSDTSLVVNRIAQILSDEKIQSLVKDNIESGRVAGFGTDSQDVELFVNEANAEAAKAIIKAFLENSEQG